MTRARDVADSALVHIATETFSAASTVSLNYVFSATYDNYRLVAQVTGTSTAVLQIRFRVAGTDTSTSTYKYGQMYVGAQASLTFGSTNNTTATFIPIGYTSNGFRGGSSVDIHAPFLTERTSIHGTTSGAYLALNGGVLDNATSYDGFTLLTGGAITGTISIYGYRK